MKSLKILGVALLALLACSTALAQVPAAPATLTATVNGTSVTLAWPAAANAQGYNVVVDSSAAAVQADVAAGNAGHPISVGNVLTYTLSNVAPGAYFYSVWGWSCTATNCLLGTGSPIASAVVGGGGGTPCSASATPPCVTLTPGPITFTWSAPTLNMPVPPATVGTPIAAGEIAGYNIYQSASLPVTLASTLVNPVPVAGLTYTTQSPYTPGTYYFAIQAVVNPATAPNTTNQNSALTGALQVVVPVVQIIVTPSTPGNFSATFSATSAKVGAKKKAPVKAAAPVQRPPVKHAPPGGIAPTIRP